MQTFYKRSKKKPAKPSATPVVTVESSYQQRFRKPVVGAYAGRKIVWMKNQMKGFLTHEYETHYDVEFVEEHGKTFPSVKMSCYVPKSFVVTVIE